MRQDQRQFALLNTPLGQPGSGRLRYAAAMYFHQKGRLGAPVLEAFRMAAATDTDDVRQVLATLELADDQLNTLVNAPNTTPIAQFWHLLDEVDRYLLQFTSPGIAEARAGIAAARGAALNMAVTPQKNPIVSAHLPAALAQLAPEFPALAADISTTSRHLYWETYTDYAPGTVGAAFEAGHAFTSLIGANAPLTAEDFDLGLFLIAPNTLYRDHYHVAPELYAPLTGPHLWRFGVDAPPIIKPAHDPVFNLPFAPHLTKTGPTPFLCIFCWTRDANAPAFVLPATDWDALEALNFMES